MQLIKLCILSALEILLSSKGCTFEGLMEMRCPGSVRETLTSATDGSCSAHLTIRFLKSAVYRSLPEATNNFLPWTACAAAPIPSRCSPILFQINVFLSTMLKELKGKSPSSMRFCGFVPISTLAAQGLWPGQKSPVGDVECETDLGEYFMTASPCTNGSQL